MGKWINIYLLLNMWRIIPSFLIFKISHNKRLEMDFERWKKQFANEFDGRSNLVWMGYLLITKPEFRNLFIYRVKNKFIKAATVKILWKKIETLYIWTDDIGGGIFIQHGFSTIINAESIGEFCSIGQQVTIGNNGDYKPTIGNGVTISAGAIVIGNIIINDNALIGAGSVVTHNVINNAVVVGVPAKLLKYRS